MTASWVLKGKSPYVPTPYTRLKNVGRSPVCSQAAAHVSIPGVDGFVVVVFNRS